MRTSWVPSRSLKAVRTPLALARHGQRRFQHTHPYTAAVIGGGITGLTSAFRLSQDPSCSQVTLYEKSSRVGGWLQSERIPVDGGDVVFEYGPRTLRAVVPTSLPLINLLVELELLDQVLMTPKTAPAACNRYIYYPDHLVRVPTPKSRTGFIANTISAIKTLMTEPVFEKALSSFLTEPLKVPSDETIYNRDESVADFVSRRLSPQVADNLVSAFFHGVYAGDIDKLSAQTLLGVFRQYESDERRVVGSIVHATTQDLKVMPLDDLMALDAVPQMEARHWKILSSLIRGASVLTLKNGIGQLADGLVATLNKSEKVKVVTDANVKAITQDPDTSDLTISYQDKSSTHNRVIATNPATDLAEKLDQKPIQSYAVPQKTINELKQHNYAVSVMVVNLYYPNPNLLPIQGFGYLIPRSIPFEQNPERALGVIFGSDSSIGQDTAPGTKLTVMMGGHWWDGWKESDYPDHDTAVSMCRSLLERHLGITEAPTLSRSRLQRNAIPQYTIGHSTRMKELSQSVRQEFRNRLTLAGSWYTGIGVGDCIRAGYLSATYGVGAQKLNSANGQRPWTRYNWQNWDLEGGIVASPVRYSEVFRSERNHF